MTPLWRRSEPSEPDQAAPSEAAAEPVVAKKRRKVRWWVVIVVVLVFLAWRAGTFDNALVNVGLNAKECARNGYGATFCGRALENYRQQVVEPMQNAVQQSQDAYSDYLDEQSKALDAAGAYQECLDEWANMPDIQATC